MVEIFKDIQRRLKGQDFNWDLSRRYRDEMGPDLYLAGGEPLVMAMPDRVLNLLEFVDRQRHMDAAMANDVFKAVDVAILYRGKGRPQYREAEDQALGGIYRLGIGKDAQKLAWPYPPVRIGLGTYPYDINAYFELPEAGYFMGSWRNPGRLMHEPAYRTVICETRLPGERFFARFSVERMPDRLEHLILYYETDRKRKEYRFDVSGLLIKES